MFFYCFYGKQTEKPQMGHLSQSTCLQGTLQNSRYSAAAQYNFLYLILPAVMNLPSNPSFQSTISQCISERMQNRRLRNGQTFTGARAFSRQKCFSVLLK